MQVHLPFENDWKALHNRLSHDERFISKVSGKTKLAGLFRPCAQDAKRGQKRILYVGKATGGPYQAGCDGYPHFNQNGSAFWRFAQDIANDKELGGVTWSNVCKTGTRVGNPNEKLMKAQEDLAIETLHEELRTSHATLMVVFTDWWQESAVYAALNLQQGAGDGFREDHTPDKKPFWIREAKSSLPAVLWIRHPERKTKEVLTKWRETAATLLK